MFKKVLSTLIASDEEMVPSKENGYGIFKDMGINPILLRKKNIPRENRHMQLSFTLNVCILLSFSAFVEDFHTSLSVTEHL